LAKRDGESRGRRSDRGSSGRDLSGHYIGDGLYGAVRGGVGGGGKGGRGGAVKGERGAGKRQQHAGPVTANRDWPCGLLWLPVTRYPLPATRPALYPSRFPSKNISRPTRRQSAAVRGCAPPR